jgi:hypothetical protein
LRTQQKSVDLNMIIIRVAACALFLALVAGCASSGNHGRSAYGGGGGSAEFTSRDAKVHEQASALPDYREILASPGAF